MLRAASLIIALLLSAALAQAASPQVQAPTQTDDDIARIVGYSLTRGGALTFLETLSDTIGGRITGSPESRAAADLIPKTLKDAGIDSAHLEEYDLTSTWRHGPATGEVISPVKGTLIIGSYGWVPGTPGPIEVPVTDFGPVGNDNSAIPVRVRGVAVIVDLRSNGSSSTYVGARAIIARRLAQARCFRDVHRFRQARPHGLHLCIWLLSTSSVACHFHSQRRRRLSPSPPRQG
jgi:hypothetical protein